MIKISYTWTIRNFSKRLETPGESLQSSEFSAGPHDKVKWRLTLFPRGTESKCEDYVSLFVLLNSCDNAKVDAELEFSVVKANGQQTISRSPGCHSFASGTDWGYHNYAKRALLFDSADEILPDDKLTIHCGITVFQDTVNVSGQTITMALTVPKCQLLESLDNMFECHKFSDVTLRVGGNEIPAHRNILSARSPVFAAMFEHDMSERAQSRVDITDLNYETVREAVRFVYTGRAPKIDELAEDLLIAADKYALDRLKAMCEEKLCSKLSVENAAEFLTLADVHSAHQLKAHALNFIVAHATNVLETAGWKELVQRQPHLIAEAFCALAHQQAGHVDSSSKPYKLSGST